GSGTRRNLTIPGGETSPPRTPSTFGLRAEGSFHLASKPEMEGDKSRNACSPCDVTGLTCRKMPPLCGNLRIRVKKRRLDEQLISTACQRHDRVDVRVVIRGAAHRGNFLPPRRAQRILVEPAGGGRPQKQSCFCPAPPAAPRAWLR